LDSTATSLEPLSVINKMHEYRTIHIRGSNHSKNSAEAKEAQERNDEARQKIQYFFNAKTYIVGFTGGTTDTSNYVATRFPFEQGDTLILTDMEHNSQILTARNFAERAGARVKYVPVSLPEGKLDLNYLRKAVSKKDKGKVLLNLVHVSNVTGVINPLDEIRDILGDRGFIYLDMAQSAGHMLIDLDDLDMDFAGISSHKMYGPMGIGAIFINKKSKRYVRNNISGGSAVDLVSKWFTAYADAPERFEPGTQDLEGAVEWGFTIDYLKKIGMDRIEKHDKELGKYFVGELEKIKGIRIYGPKDFKDRTAVVTFNNTHMGRNHEEFAQRLDRYGISVRDGCFCAHMYTSQLLGAPRILQEFRTLAMKGGVIPKGLLMIPGAVRASFAFYNTLEDAYKAVIAINAISRK
jgi:cysteine desulfurase/selenocysteine lyase